VSSRFFDAVILGRSLGSLTAAALLARRDFRVLLVGNGKRPPSYRFESRVLGRRTFTLLFGSSPVFRRVLHELAQSPQFRRRTTALDPMFAFLMEGRRFELPPDVELFAREVDREFPEVRQIVDEMYGTITDVNSAADGAFERDNVWPPGTLWERFETGHAASLLPYDRGERAPDVLQKFPIGHPYRDIATLPAQFGSYLAASAEQLPALALARLHGAWARGVGALAGGEHELTQFMIERIEAHGGVCALERRVESLLIKNGSASAVQLDGDDEPTGAGAVITDQWGEALAELSGGAGLTRAAERDWPRLSPEAGRFVVSLLVRDAAVPSALPAESFLMPPSGRKDPRRPLVRLQRHVPRVWADDANVPEGETLLMAECLLPTRGSLTVLEARRAVLDTVETALPFLSEHLVLVDSVHDGLPLVDYASGVRREIDRVHLTGASPGAEAMERLWTVDPPGFRGLAGEPVRGPIPNTFLVGPTVLPALGQEGELLAGFSVARLVTRRDRARQRMRQKLWSKIETT
jgi:phytoene dehydrogenase-like protein